jgi:preprotein translocase subunit SecG
MANIVLVIHLILALCLIGIVLMQRSEGGGLGIGGGGGGAMSGRAAAGALVKLTWFFAIAFIATSITLTILAARDAAGDSVIERLGAEVPATTEEAPAPVPPGLGDNLLPPTATDAPATPPKATE